MEVVEPLNDLLRWRVGEEDADLAFYLLERGMFSCATSTETSMGRTCASLCNPSLCSSSGVVPRAFAITAPRPKNIRPELGRHGSSMNAWWTDGSQTYSFHSFRTVFRCAFRMFPTSNSQQYCHLSAFACTYRESGCSDPEARHAAGVRARTSVKRTFLCSLSFLFVFVNDSVKRYPSGG